MGHRTCDPTPTKVIMPNFSMYSNSHNFCNNDRVELMLVPNDVGLNNDRVELVLVPNHVGLNNDRVEHGLL